ncbi:MAG TPA: hypothetical protein VII95_11580 [Terriglobales bacterium]|jgi:hypothetical protein
MARRKSSKRSKAKTILRLPDLEQSKNAVLHSLAAASSQESYGHAIDEFIGWYCSEPRLAFNRTVVLRYRFFLEQKNLAPSTINVRLAAVRRLAYEASDTGLLSPELAAGIRRVKGAKRLGVRIGNWLTVEQSSRCAGLQAGLFVLWSWPLLLRYPSRVGRSRPESPAGENTRIVRLGASGELAQRNAAFGSEWQR